MYRKERPRCRKVIERLLKEKHCSLEQFDVLGIFHSKGLLIQHRKMLEEKQR